jgi:hypothetical protein
VHGLQGENLEQQAMDVLGGHIESHTTRQLIALTTTDGAMMQGMTANTPTRTSWWWVHMPLCSWTCLVLNRQCWRLSPMESENESNTTKDLTTSRLVVALEATTLQ